MEARPGGKANDVERIFQIMNDSAGKTADKRETFGVKELLADARVIEITQAPADLADEPDGQLRSAV